MNISLIILSLLAILAAIEAALKTRDKFVSKPKHPSSTETPVPPVTRKETSELDVESGSSSEGEPISNVSNITPNSATSEQDIPLATSLTLSEVVDPVHPKTITIPDLYPGYPLEAEQQSQTHHTPDVLQEITQLDHREKKDQIAHLAQYVQHPDSVLRVAIASALGGLLPQTEGDDRHAAIALLNHLSQDVDSQVRVQAAASLGELYSTEITP